jgi:anti-anti-sigma factor
MQAMLKPHYPHLKCSLVDDVLVLTITETHFQGDRQAEAARQAMLDALSHSGAKKVVIDLQTVKYLSSVGFRPLLTLRRRLQEIGGQMVLCNLSPEVTEVFRSTRMISTGRSSSSPFVAQSDLAAALASLHTDDAEE